MSRRSRTGGTPRGGGVMSVGPAGGSRHQLGVGDLVVSPRAKELVGQVLESNRLSYGPMHERLERMFADLHRVKFSLFMNSGTSALQVALAALKIERGWKDGDEVIVPAITFVATANVVLQNGLKPVFVDVEPDTFNLDPTLIDRAITRRTRCIMPVHLLGQPADMDPILAIARRRRLAVVEDSCEAMFVRYRGRPVGSMGDVGCFSTYVAHFVVTGVGGFAATSNPRLHVRMRSLANHGRDSIYLAIDDDRDLEVGRLREVVARRFKFVHLGYSYRCTEMEAALGIAQMEESDTILRSRRENARYLTRSLEDLRDELQLPVERPDREHGYMLYGLVVKKGSKRGLVNHLEEHGIETRDLFPLVNQPVYRGLFRGDPEAGFPVARALNRKGFYLGCHQHLSRDDLDYMADMIRSWVRRPRRA